MSKIAHPANSERHCSPGAFGVLSVRRTIPLANLAGPLSVH